MKDALGDRMKTFEKQETERKLMPGLPVIIRVDGRGFSKFTKRMQRPYDQDLCNAMDETAKFLLVQLNATVVYTQSDEIQAIIDPKLVEGKNTFEELPFNGRIQKIVGLAASITSVKFYHEALQRWPEHTHRMLPHFDARAFQVPTRQEAVAAMIWREIDATKNAVSMAAQHHFSHNSLQGMNSAQMQERLYQEKGINFNDYPARFKRGVYFRRCQVWKHLDAETLAKIPEEKRPAGPILRHEVQALNLPPIRRIHNPLEVLFEGKEVVLKP